MACTPAAGWEKGQIEKQVGFVRQRFFISKPLFFVNRLLPVEPETLESAILAISGERNESRQDTIEGRLVAIIREITSAGGLDRFAEWSIKTNVIRNKFNEGRPDRLP